jgi:hypothetical protein
MLIVWELADGPPLVGVAEAVEGGAVEDGAVGGGAVVVAEPDFELLLQPEANTNAIAEAANHQPRLYPRFTYTCWRAVCGL